MAKSIKKKTLASSAQKPATKPAAAKKAASSAAKVTKIKLAKPKLAKPGKKVAKAVSRPLGRRSPVVGRARPA